MRFSVFLLSVYVVHPEFSERGSEYRGVSLMQGVCGTQTPRCYRCFLSLYKIPKLIPNVRLRAYLSKYKEEFNQIWNRGCGGCNPLEDIGCFIIYSAEMTRNNTFSVFYTNTS